MTCPLNRPEPGRFSPALTFQPRAFIFEISKSFLGGAVRPGHLGNILFPPSNPTTRRMISAISVSRAATLVYFRRLYYQFKLTDALFITAGHGADKIIITFRVSRPEHPKRIGGEFRRASFALIDIHAVPPPGHNKIQFAAGFIAPVKYVALRIPCRKPVQHLFIISLLYRKAVQM